MIDLIEVKWLEYEFGENNYDFLNKENYLEWI